MMENILENVAAILWIVLGIATAIRLRDYDRRADALMSEMENIGGNLRDE